ncbi:MAG: hypothetical protein ACKVIN_13155 [Longimicrobiales bacterium]
MTSRMLVRPIPRTFAAAVIAAGVIGQGAMTTTVSAATAMPQESTEDMRVEKLVGGWIDALGGLATYEQLESARYTLTTEMYDAGSSRLRRTRPRYVTIARSSQGELGRIDRWEGDDFIEQGWDGSEVWARLNGTKLSAGAKDFDEVQYVSGDLNYWIALPYKLRDGGVTLHNRGADDLGRTIVGVSFGAGVGLHDGDAWQYWFEDGRTWPVQVAYKEEGRTNWNYLRFEDIRTIDGYTFVGRRVHFNDDGQVTKVLYTHDFELNPELGLEAFSNGR